MYILSIEKQVGSKLMFMLFETVSICVWLWYVFSETCHTAANSHLHKYHMIGSVYVYGFGTCFQKHVILQLIQIYIYITC